MIDNRQLQQVRQQLESERAQLWAELAPEETTDDEPPYNLDRGDLANEARRQHRAEALQALDEQKLEQIDAALERIAAGTYGQCANCQQPINRERLEVLPYATLCIDCQEETSDTES